MLALQLLIILATPPIVVAGVYLARVRKAPLNLE